MHILGKSGGSHKETARDNNPSQSDNAQKYLELTIYLVIFVVSILFVAAGLLIKYLYKDADDFWSLMAPFFLSELGIAGIIALVIISTIEKFTKKRHEKAANKLISRMNINLFHAIYGRYIPSKIFEEVEKCLLNSRVLRTDYSIDYSLNYITDDEAREHQITPQDKDNHLFCGVFSRYKLTNASARYVKHLVEIHLELPIDKSMKRFIRVDNVKINDVAIDEKVITDSCRYTDQHLIFSHPVRIPQGGEVSVSMNCHTIKRKLDAEVWASRIPSDGLILRVTMPEGLHVKATANHSEPLEMDSIDNGKTHIWQLNHGIFPFQSVIFWWKATE